MRRHLNTHPREAVTHPADCPCERCRRLTRERKLEPEKRDDLAVLEEASSTLATVAEIVEDRSR